jgi:YggT family protein
MTYRNDPAVDETGEHVTYDNPPARGDQVNVNAGERTAYVEREDPLAVVRRVVGLIFGILIAVIGLRILLLALGANEGNGLVDGIYGISEPLVAPFRGVFSMDEVRPAGQSVLDIAAVVAIVGWSLIGLLVMAILRIPMGRRAY